ncbi:TatD family hydrolase [Ramlibacter sp. AW1]|uniref:TatD family hydrolase n=1 Tax=Ramlibacter aurantiacus TaxID=2801330 RepID=A0A936ZP30_9BURK|nr:TatD family hydrolase [Ramlibacter aurantiacus]MBL0420910.1 TatD family hydrolase [Ramlibacter aurantiacus]
MAVWIDTHCHADASEFDGRWTEVRRRAGLAGVARCVLPAVAVAGFDRLRQLAHAGGDAYALGIHPLCTGSAAEDDVHALDRALEANADDPRLVAVGEIGLDFFVQGLDADRQLHFLRAQLRLAQRFGLPVILHVRRSADVLLRELRRIPVAGGIAHAFNGSRQQAGAFIELGFKLGFGGTVTYERSLRIRQLARELPLSSLVLETDAPDIPPRWLYRTASERADGAAQGCNEPAELPAIGGVLAQLRGLAPDELAQATALNAQAALPRLAALAPAG